MPKVLISDKMSPKATEVFSQYPGVQVDVKTGLKPEELQAIIGEYDGLCIRSATKVTPEIFSAAKNLKIIARAGSGVDNIDREAANKNGTYITNTPGGNTVTTAEHAISMMMALTRNIPQGTMTLKKGEWAKNKLQGREVFQKTLGVIGFGNIGRIVADRAIGLKMKVVAFDKFPNEEAAKAIGVEMVSLDDLLAHSDYITMHLIKTPETTNFITKDQFAKMKNGVFFINCSRGGIVNEDDLFDALTSGKVAGAALDVFGVEPPGEHKLLGLDTVIATPHLGASTQEAQDNVAIAAAEQVAVYLTTGELRNALNEKDVVK
jgi:D-3-phosphoglycerate dehydrogenase